MTDTPEPAGPAGGGEAAGAPASAPVSRRVVIVLAVASAIVLVVAGVVGTRIAGIWGGDDPVPEATASPTPEPLSPFAGTPAEGFPEGADGIVPPRAEAAGDFTADQVADALERVRDALIAARLDPSMLIEHEPAGLLEVLAPDLRPALGSAFGSEASTTFATQLAEGAALLPVAPRVTGTIEYRTTPAGAQDTEVIEITTRFTWVYAFAPATTPGTAAPGTAAPATASGQPGGADLVAVRDVILWRMQIGEPWVDESRGLWLFEPDSAAWGADCDAYAEGLLRPDDQPATTLAQAEEAEAIFDPEQPLDVGGGC